MSEVYIISLQVLLNFSGFAIIAQPLCYHPFVMCHLYQGNLASRVTNLLYYKGLSDESPMAIVNMLFFSVMNHLYLFHAQWIQEAKTSS